MNDKLSNAAPMETVPSTSSPGYAKAHPVTRAFDTFASAVTRWAGSPVAFGLAVIAIMIWIVTGPVFKFSDGWQLVINTGTTIITFLMVFLIQQSANKDSVALHLKLNELLASNKRANNQLIGIEDATEDELRKLAAAYLQLVEKHDASSELTGDDGVAAEIARRLADARATDSAESQTRDAT
ncbi:low affinity iron permease family protein [Caballeronia sp. LZ032]|uniref:low affinity iron permease family protein n=1 Tax=Caballeronia sp. LZ032 TaxID=3038565 RepID=UPI00285C5047|nr:low affinity iron permease family protein [Caballeronia sp. LZ032]MDR5884228.1 low affinity iron permease family protein [Caballeronia sp. LZ032]